MNRLIAFIPLVALGGCIVEERRPVYVERRPVYVEQRSAVVVDGPVIDGPGVVVMETEPAPVERVYVYDEGYPPGTYIYGGFYYYGGYRYEHDVFVTRFVEVNIREHRYVNVEENRRLGADFETRHREQYERTGGRVDPNYVAKLRAGQEQHAKAYQYGQEQKQKAARYEADQKAKASRYEGDQAAKAGRYEADQKAAAGRYEGEQKAKAGRYEGEQKAKAGEYEQQHGNTPGIQPARVSPQQNSNQLKAQQEKERLEAAQEKKNQNQKKPQEHQ